MAMAPANVPDGLQVPIAEYPQMNYGARDYEGLQVSPESTFYEKQMPERTTLPCQHDVKYRGPLGLGIWAFACLVSAITAVVVGSAVGGGLGAALHQRSQCDAQTSDAPTGPTQACDAPTTTTVTIPTPSSNTNYIPLPPSEVESLAMPENCNDSRLHDGWKYNYYCEIGNPPGVESEEGGPVRDVTSLIAYTHDDCANACIEVNRYNKRFGIDVECKSVVFDTAMAKSVEEKQANCWLKNATRNTKPEWPYDGPSLVYITVSQ